MLCTLGTNGLNGLINGLKTVWELLETSPPPPFRPILGGAHLLVVAVELDVGRSGRQLWQA